VFGTSDIIAVRILSIGTTLTVSVDSLLVCCLRLLASLTLLGPQAWWLPWPLARLRRRTGLHEDDESARRLDVLSESGGGV
jgi:hypothetical protein